MLASLLAHATHGFDSDTLFNGLLLATVIAAVLAVRMRTVFRTGGYEWKPTCQQCDYKLDGLEQGTRCPECGIERAGRALVPAGRRTRISPDLERAFGFVPIAVSIILTGVCRPLIWDAHNAMGIGRYVSLSYRTGPVTAWVTWMLLGWCVLYWFASVVRNSLYTRSVAVAIIIPVVSFAEILRLTPSPLRFDYALQTGIWVPFYWSGLTVLAATGIAIALDHFAVKTPFPWGDDNTLEFHAGRGA